MVVKLTSVKNPVVKFALTLKKSGVRKSEKLFIVEGYREIKLALQAGYKIRTLFLVSDIADNESFNELKKEIGTSGDLYEITREIFSRMAYREGVGGLIAIAESKNLTLDDLRPGRNPLIIVAEGLEKPGNLGAILRTADAAGVDAVIVCDSKSDIYNPNIVRSSLGCLFTNKIACATSEIAISWLRENGISIYTTSLNAVEHYNEADFTKPTAIVVGAEDTGVSDLWESGADSTIIIPMFGKVDSMNVSVAASVVLYEALRQRDFKRE